MILDPSNSWRFSAVPLKTHSDSIKPELVISKSRIYDFYLIQKDVQHLSKVATSIDNELSRIDTNEF